MRASFRLFTRENLFAAAFIVILVTLLWLVFSVLEPFWMDFMWALFFALTLSGSLSSSFFAVDRNRPTALSDYCLLSGFLPPSG